ncbi:MAG: hypothetical protein WCE64_10635 [Bacteroidales bacterium]
MKTYKTWIIIAVLFSIAAISSAQSGTDNESQFLFHEYSPATIILKAGGTQTADLNYNTVSGKMVFMRDGVPYELLSAILIDTIYLQNCTFVRINNSFFELLVNAPVPLFLQHKGILALAGKPSGYGTTSNTSSITSVSVISDNYKNYNLELPSDFKVIRENIYWIRNAGGELESFINQRQLLGLFPDISAQLQAHIRAGKIKFDRKEQVAELIRFCNELIK